jgi:hypothetical protein
LFLSESEIKTKKVEGCDFGGFQSPQHEKNLAKVFIFEYLVFSV